MAIVDGTGYVHPTDDGSMSQIEAWAQDYAQAKADQAELETAKQVLALALSKLPKQQIKLSLSEQAKLGAVWGLQMKREEKSGAILFRAVKTFGN